MSFRLEIRDRASDEFIESYLWYEQQRNGLGEEFHDEVEEHFAFLRERPEGFAKWRGPYKKINLKRFPYIIVFRVVRMRSLSSVSFTPGAIPSAGAGGVDRQAHGSVKSSALL